MAAFEYTALDSRGRTQKGVVSADSQKAARKELRTRALTPLKLSPVKESRKGEAAGSSRRRIKSHELVLMTRQLALLIGSGAPVEEAVGAVGTNARDANTRAVLASVRAGIVEGQSLSNAMRAEARTFSPLYRAIVRAGEGSGALGSVLERLADNLEKSQAMKRKVTAALVYPVILLIVAMAVIVGLMVFVVPTIVEQFDGMGEGLPLITEIVIAISDFLKRFGLFILGGVVVALVLFNRAMAQDSFKRGVDRFVLGLPVIGPVVRSVSAARFSRTFAALSLSGAPVLDAIAAARETTSNLVLRDAVDAVAETVRKGGALNTAMAQTGEFPPLVVHMAAGGESSGRLGEVFERGANHLEAEFEAKSTVALNLLEPVITVIMGGLVLVIILAIMLPIMELNTGAALR